jgi:hypothetical protein
MFHPVGTQSPSVYWRRRLFMIGGTVLLAVLVVLTGHAVMSDGRSAPLADTSTGAHSAAPNPHHHKKSSKKHTKPAAPHTKSGKPSSPSSSSSAPSSSAAPPPRCGAGDLDVSAVVAEPSYAVGQEPVLELQVVNTSTAPCVQDLADKQVELRVYNGESRVWGSHDCQIQAGTDDRVLPVGRAVRVSITWTGLSSNQGCTDTRQRVGAGTYTLYAYLSGNTGKATTFALT